MIQLTDNLEINKPAPVDDRLGAFESTAEALAYINEDRRYIGLTIIVDNGTGAHEYWFKDGVTDSDLIVKSEGGGTAWGTITGTLSNQTDLQTALNAKANTSSLATVATSGSYNDLTNKPTIPSAQVNSDWNSTSGVSQILNKPTIPSITGLVPYTGATQDVDLGNNNLNAKGVKINGTAGNGHVGLKHQSTNATAQGQETALFAGSDGELYYKNDGLSVAQIPSKSYVDTQLSNKVTANGSITGATKTKITYDSKGLVTAGADLTASDIPTLNSYPQVYFVNSSASASVTTLAKIFEGSAINITDLRVGTTFICTGFYTGSASSTKGFGLSSNNTTPTLATASFTSGQFYFIARYIGGVNGTLRITRVGGNGFGVSSTTSYVDINASSGTHTLSFWGSSSTGTIIVEHCLIQMIY